jgi:outer membrane receptor protein involved in Fe transport
MSVLFKKYQKTLFLFLLSAFLGLTASYAQSIKGTVVDARSGEPLVGANVSIKGTAYKSIVKLDGSFLFKSVTPGTYELTVDYVGFKTETFEKFTLSQNGTKEINIKLHELSSKLTDVTVVGASNKESDNFARRLERTAEPVMNVMSAKTIQLLPDITVANALQRVSGVTIEKSGSGEARYPIIRGMEKRYIATTVNGIKIPSPDNRSRYIPLDLFPSELLERLEVSKSLTPSMEGDAIGGSINLVMKDAPAKFLLQANVSTGYNNSFNSGGYDKFSPSSISKESPAEIHGNTYQATPADLSNQHLNYSNVTRPMNTTAGLTIGNRIGKDKKFGFIVSGSYQNLYRGTSSNFFLPNAQPGLNNIPLFSDLQLRDYSVQSKRVGVNGKLDYQINKHNKIALVNTFVRLDDYQTRIIWDTVALNSVVDNSFRSQWQYQTIYNSTLLGTHDLSPSLKLDWNLAYSKATNHVADQASFTHQYAIVATSLTTDKLQSNSHLWQHNSDQDYSGSFNITESNEIFGKSLELKVGGLLRQKKRDNFYNTYSLSPVLNAVYTTINAAQFIFKTPADGIPSITGNNYTFNENIGAGYVQGKLALSSKLEALGGFRAEFTHQRYNTQLTQDVYAKSGTIDYSDLLPSLQFKYSLSRNQNLRFSYYKALARPGFAELIPDGIDGEFFKEIGDPVNLVHSVADNLDIRYELYSKTADQILLGVFYKNIKDPIEIAAVKPQGVNSLYLMPVNKGTATNYGFEAVVTKYFGAFGISANYTYTKSSITDSLLYSFRNTAGAIVSSKVEETRPLQGQSNHIGNLSLIYKNPKIGFDLQVAGVYTGERISFLSPYSGLNYWQSPTTTLDISFEKRIVNKLTIYGKINNITNAPFELSLHESYNNYMAASGSRPLALQTDPENRIIIQKDYYRTTFLLGLRFKL